MGDVFFEQVIKENAYIRNGEKPKTAFYGKYAVLNGVQAPGLSEINKKQLSTLKALERQARQRDFQDMSKLNNFLFQALSKHTAENENTVFQNAINEVYNSLSQVYPHGKLEGEALQQRVAQNVKAFKATAAAVAKVNSNLDANNQISGEFLAELQTAIKTMQAKIGTTDYDTAYSHVNNLRGELLEKMGVSFFNQYVPKNMRIEAFDSGKIMKNSSQVISDILLLSTDIPKVSQLTISYYLNGKEVKKDLQSFLADLRNGNNTINFESEEEYNKLLKQSLAGIQAKSGRLQNILNEEHSEFKYSIRETGNPYISVFDNLASLYGTQSATDYWSGSRDMNTELEVYNRLADAGIVNILGKLLHINVQENSYMLTRSGITTYASRVLELYGKSGRRKNSYFHFTGGVILESGWADKKRSITVTGSK